MQSKQRNILNLASSMVSALTLGTLGFLVGKKASNSDEVASAAMVAAGSVGIILGNQIATGAQDENQVKALIKACTIEKLQGQGLSKEQVLAVVKDHDFTLATPPRYGFWQNIKNLATTALGGLLLCIPIGIGGALAGRHLGRCYDRWQDKQQGREGDETGVLGEVIGSQVGGLIALPFSFYGMYKGNQYFDAPDQSYLDKEADRHVAMLANMAVGTVTSSLA